MDADIADGGLRPYRAPLFGRDAELARLDRWLDDGERLVTLTGSGGIGKTRLATELALRREAREPVCFVDLGGASGDVEALTAIARALGTGVAGMDARDMAPALARSLRTRDRTVLVLDAVDRVLGDLAPILDGWLDAAPEAVFVVTSRERLALSGERVMVVPPLDVAHPDASPAVALFVDRATRAGADVAFTGPERQALGELVRRLDGLPLAIELAAARADAVPPSQMLVELGHRFDVLAAGQVDMRATVGFSWDLLREDARQGLACLGVLTGPFDLPTAAAVMGVADLDALAMLEHLGRRSLAAVHGTEYALLETIRDFARERGRALGLELPAVARRDTFVVERAEALLSASRAPGGAAPLAALGRLHVQLQALVSEAAAGGPTTAETALRAAIVAATSMRRAGISAPGDGGLPELAARAAAAHADPRRVVAACHLAARFLFDRGRPEEALAAVQRGRALLPDPLVGRAEATLLEARHAFIAGRMDEALRLNLRGRDEAAHDGEPEIEGLALMNLALTRMRLGEPGDALAELDRAHELFVAGGALDYVPLQLGVTFFIATGLGDRARARAALVEALRVARDVGNVRDETGLGVYLALAELDDGRLIIAQERAEVAFGVAARAHEHLACQCATLILQITIERGRLTDGARWYLTGRRMLEAYASASDGVWLDALEAARRALAGDLAGARALVDEVARTTGVRDQSRAAAAGVLAAVTLAAEALELGRRGDSAAADERLAAAARLRADSAAQATRNDDLRRALALVDRALAAAGGGPEVVCVSLDAGAFRRGARWEDLGKKPTLQRLFAALAHARVGDAGQALGALALAEAGWPGERMLEDARDNRLYVTLSKLRHTGLEGVVEHDRAGWRLAPEIPILWVERRAWELPDGHGDAR